MNACVLFFSLTGNTKRFAETTSKKLNILVFDLAKSMPSIVDDYDVLILGTPVYMVYLLPNPSLRLLKNCLKLIKQRLLFSQLMQLEKGKQIRN